MDGSGNTSPPPGGAAARRTPDPAFRFNFSDPINLSHPSLTTDSPPVRLKKRTIRLGTWNMRGRSGPSGVPKVDTAKLIMKLEKVDLLVLTETHSTDDNPPSSRGLKILAHSGIDPTRAGVAVCAVDNGQWHCRSSNVLVPGHAILCELYNSVSTETIRLLGAYADIRDYTARTQFYENLYSALSDHILVTNFGSLSLGPSPACGPLKWNGCFAAGDWNFVESDSDRVPYKVPSGDVRRCRAVFSDIKSLCLMGDTAGHTGLYKGHTFSQNARGVRIFSRLDRIYFPNDGWTASSPVAIPTNHSDHLFVWADCFCRSPRVEIARPAPRLPPLPHLEQGRFWPEVLSLWTSLSSYSITLPRWSSFKKEVLRIGLAAAGARRKAITSHWKDALRGDAISDHDLAEITFNWSSRPPPPVRKPRVKWPSALPSYDITPPPTRCPRKALLYPPALDALHLHNLLSSDISPPRAANVTDAPTSRPPPAPAPSVADVLDARIKAKRAAQLKKYKDMERLHTSAWFNLSSNKEADERGSRASVSVEGLRRSTSGTATTDLRHMLHIARDHFRTLHTPQPISTARSLAQSSLLSEVAAEYGPKPAPPSNLSGRFTLAEVTCLRAKMPNTAPGPDGLPYGFYKALASKVKTLADPGSDIRPFWDVFQDLANDIRTNGSNRCNFKLANLSLFYKKGDPTLVSNYRPISSMNTDCKMYTNLINSRISPWAVTKLHPDQAGFVPGRLITDHTRLASEVAHLSNASGTDGYIVSLDQAKAYDKTDIPWLLRVLTAMGIPDDLISLVDDITSGCRTRVRINSGLSSSYVLNVGLRQGDPLSPILYDFSIEPLGMRMRHTISGISCLGLPPAKLLMYADDMNLFVSKSEDFPRLRTTLSESTLAIGCKFNLDKTDILVVGSAAHRSSPTHDDIRRCFDEAYILPTNAPLRVLGVWIGSPDRASPRWKQILAHIKKLASQWNGIGASILNRVLLAKALMLSRCYYLLDGNSIPPILLQKINNVIQRFVRGSYSSAPYRLLEAPLTAGSLNCPSLSTRKLAYDAKFVSDLISGPANTPWRAWTFADLSHASVFHSSAKPGAFPGPFNPLLQSCHCRYTLLEPRVRAAWASIRSLRYDIRCAFPSQAAVLDMPSVLHPSRRTYHLSKLKCLVSTGLTTVGRLADSKQLLSALSKRPKPTRRFITHSSDESCPSSDSETFTPARRPGRPQSSVVKLRSRLKGVRALPPGLDTDIMLAAPMVRNILRDLNDSRWSLTTHRPTNHMSGSRVRIWPNMTNALGCARLLTGSHSLLAHSKLIRGWAPEKLSAYPKYFSPYLPHTPASHDDLDPVCADPVRIWTDGSAFDNGIDSCVCGAAWVSSHGASGHARVIDSPSSNNIAETVAITMALLSWRHSDLLIHTDSKYVLGLVNGGLLSMERDGWPDESFSLCPPRPPSAPSRDLCDPFVSSTLLHRYLLYLLRSHDGYVQFKWVKAHAGDALNSQADSLAKEAALSSRHFFSVASISIPPNWVDAGPVLNHQSLAFLTDSIVLATVPRPLLDDKSSDTRSRWCDWASGFSSCWLDAAHHLPNIWKINIPTQLRELLWKEINSSLPLGHSWASKVRLGDACPCNGSPVNYIHVWVHPRCEYTNGQRAIRCRCGSSLSLSHIWKGCRSYDMSPFRDLLENKLRSLVYLSAPTTTPDKWMGGDMWFPLIALRSLELCSDLDMKHRRVLAPSRKAREWAMGSFLWFTWRMRMKEVHSSSMVFSPRAPEFLSALSSFMDEYSPTANELRFAPRVVHPDLAPPRRAPTVGTPS